MTITRIAVRYGELRSTGYPNFSNTRNEIEITAVVQVGESAEQVRTQLLDIAKKEVAKAFGDQLEPPTAWTTLREPVGDPAK